MPFFLPLIALCTGIAAGSLMDYLLAGLLVVLAGCGIHFFIIVKSTTPLSTAKYHRYHNIWIFLLFAGVGYLTISFHQPYTISSNQLNRYRQAEGTIHEIKTTTTGDKLTVNVHHLADTTGKILKTDNLRIIVASDAVSLDVGDIVTFPCQLRVIEDNPNFKPTGYADRVRLSGINYLTTAKGEDIVLTGHKRNIRSESTRLRTEIIKHLEKSNLSRPACNFIIALLLGDRTFIGSDTKDIFSNAGMAHILALSGLHIAILTIILLYALYPLRFVVGRNIHCWSVILLIWMYVFLSGAAPSTVRASLMATLTLLAITLQRKNQALNSLFGAAFIILLISPDSLFDIGMQLSVVTVAAIIVFANRLNPADRHAHSFIFNIMAAVTVSLVATGASWIIISHYFHQVPLQFLPANFFILPVIPIFMGIALIYTIFLCAGIDICFVANILNRMYGTIVDLTGFLSSNGSSVIEISADTSAVVLWLAGISLLAYPLLNDTRKRRIFISCGLLCMAGSIISITLTARQETSFIIQEYRHDISMVTYTDNRESFTVFPRNAVSMISVGNVTVICIDCNINDFESSDIKDIRSSASQPILLLGSGFKENSLSHIPNLEKYTKIILHPSLTRKMEQKYISEAQEMNLNNLYSLRESGPFASSRENLLTSR